MSADPYTYPGTNVLKNKLGIRDARALDRAERKLVLQRASEDVPEGHFDLTHLCAIHRHLFQDIYDWAGKLREVEISKAGQAFQFRQFIETGLADVHRRLAAQNYLRGLSADTFAEKVAVIIGDINYVHPFRDGNGRTQLHFLDRLAARAGHSIDLVKLDPQRWNEASRLAHEGNYEAMRQAIGEAFETNRD